MLPTVLLLDHTQPDVAARIVELQREAYAVEAKLIGYWMLPGLLESADDVAQLDLTILGAMLDGDLVGLIGYERVGDLVDIDRVAVHPPLFRRGFATRMIEHLHERESDAQGFELSTGAANHPALCLWTKMGYQLGREEDRSGVKVILLARAAASESSGHRLPAEGASPPRTVEGGPA